MIYTSCDIRVACIAGNFGRKIFWRYAEKMLFDGIYFGGVGAS